MYRGIRSSRKLEEACNYRFDFIWLVEGRHIDHTTFAKFRTRFHQPLKELFKQIGRIAMALGLIRLGEVAFDATRAKASNSRFATRTAKTLEEKLQVLDELFEHLSSQLNAADAEDLYNTLENEIIPLYYLERSADGLPGEWLARVKESIKTLAPAFSMRRMIREYTEKLYLPGLETVSAKEVELG
jgi:hypothetical protein